MWLPSSSQGHLCFCSTDLPLARTRWVQSRFSSHCPLSSHQRSWLTSETSIISSLKVFWERWELNLGPLGEKQVWYLCAMQPTMVINVFFFRSRSRPFPEATRRRSRWSSSAADSNELGRLAIRRRDRRTRTSSCSFSSRTGLSRPWRRSETWCGKNYCLLSSSTVE